MELCIRNLSNGNEKFAISKKIRQRRTIKIKNKRFRDQNESSKRMGHGGSVK